MTPIRIILVEDDERLAAAVCRTLANHPDFELLAAFISAEEALEKADWAMADVLISDLGLPGISGVELIGRVKTIRPQLLILAYTLFADHETVFSALQAGASGYLLKGCSILDLKESIRRIFADEAPISPAIARRLLGHFLRHQPVCEGEPLTPRERKVLILIADDMTYKEVAGQLGVSAHTVHGHIKKIYAKLQVSDRSSALAKAEKLDI